MFKKGEFNFYENQIEYLFILTIVIGFIIGLFTNSVFIVYLTMIFIGLIVGRLYFFKQKKLPSSRYILTFAFVLGFIVANPNISWLWLIFWFLISAYGSFKLHQHKIINFLE